ncbi:MAG: NAD(P)H-hydrate dehydratase [Thermodesulfobacteriota bacterium]|nr:NAD(P)H-hydrate dehydratase [Thermodesulfobacteriota bacterium]
MKLSTAEQMRNLDATAINDYGIPGIVLMENAGQGTVVAMNQRFGSFAGKIVSIFVGPGNNGGDGFVIARHLHQQRAKPYVFMLVKPEKLKGDAATNFKIVRKLPIPIHILLNIEDLRSAEGRLAHSQAVVDAIFGTGLTRDISGHFADVITRINRFTCPVVSVDIPSGLNSDTGQVMGISVQARLTSTYGLAKTGMVVEPGRNFAGDMEVVDITIPFEAVEQAAIQTELLDSETVMPWIPARNISSHKGTFGHLLIVAGSTGKTGAAILSGRGALRSGAGLVTLCVPRELNPIFEEALHEAMTIPMTEDSGGIFSGSDWNLIKESMAGKQAVAVGPGMGTKSGARELVMKFYLESELPMIVDADGLNILSMDRSRIKDPPAPRILTPHPGEMARLAGMTTREIQGNRLEIASSFAKENRVILALKGAATIIAAPDGRIAVNPTGNPGMATGGMGDVLTGLIGGLLAQGLDVWQAACLGVYVHGLAADRLAAVSGVRVGFIAGDVARELPKAFNQLSSLKSLPLGFAPK